MDSVCVYVVCMCERVSDHHRRGMLRRRVVEHGSAAPWHAVEPTRLVQCGQFHPEPVTENVRAIVETDEVTVVHQGAQQVICRRQRQRDRAGDPLRVQWALGGDDVDDMQTTLQ